MPELRRQGNVTQLFVEGEPFLILGGELGLEALVADVFEDLGISTESATDPAAADVVFALVDRASVVSSICNARRCGRAPVIAILSVRDDRLSKRATDSGASAFFSLDTPVDQLKFAVIKALGAQLGVSATASRVVRA